MNRFLRTIYFLIVFFCFFPYIAILPLPTDSSPNALIISFIGLFFLIANRKFILTRDFVRLLIIAAVSVMLILFTDNKFNGIRYAGNYVSLFFLTYVSYVFMRMYGKVPYKFYKISVFVWFLVGFIQSFIYPDFLIGVTSRNFSSGIGTSLTEGGRGALGLAPEPTYYGWICVQFLIMGLLNYRREKKFALYIILILISLVILSRSSGALLFLLLSLVIWGGYAVLRVNLKAIKYAIVAVIISIPLLILLSNSETRMGYFIRGLSENNNMLVEDGSANERMNHVLISFKGCFNNFGLPNGYESFGEYYNEQVTIHRTALQGDYIYQSDSKGNKIMSSLGGMVYELGVYVSLLFFVILFKIFIFAKNNYIFVLCLTLYVLTIVNALPFAQGFVCLLLANMLYLKDSRQQP
jgi:hypothetical protein